MRKREASSPVSNINTEVDVFLNTVDNTILSSRRDNKGSVGVMGLGEYTRYTMHT